MTNKPKILIVAPQPYNKNEQSRSLNSYFHQFDKGNLAQIFSDARTPSKGNCATLFQITDFRLAKRRFKRSIKTGQTFKWEDLPDNAENSINTYRPKHKTPFYRFLRKWVWRKKYWDTPELEKFVDDLKPDYVFMVFSPDFFVFDISLHFAGKYQIPLIGCVYDDYVFSEHHKGQWLNRLYMKKYLQTVDKFMNTNPILIFESNKIQKRYKEEYKCSSTVIYISSDIKPKPCQGIDLTKDWYFFGNLEAGRLDSLKDVANILGNLNSPIKVHIYSKDISKEDQTGNLCLHPAIPYAKVLKTMEQAGALLIVESLSDKYLPYTEYSLSTKVGDSLAFGKPVIAYGNKNSGCISFLEETSSCYIADSKEDLEKLISNILNGKEDPKVYQRQFETAKTCFSIDEQSQKFLNLLTSIKVNNQKELNAADDVQTLPK